MYGEMEVIHHVGGGNGLNLARRKVSKRLSESPISEMVPNTPEYKVTFGFWMAV
jgi:hypothetical protein